MSKKVLIILAVCCVVSVGIGTGLGMLIVNNRAEVAVEIAAPPAPPAPAPSPDPEQAKEAWRQAIGGNQLKSEYEEYEKQWAEQDARREREAAAKAAKAGQE